MARVSGQAKVTLYWLSVVALLSHVLAADDVSQSVINSSCPANTYFDEQTALCQRCTGQKESLAGSQGPASCRCPSGTFDNAVKGGCDMCNVEHGMVHSEECVCKPGYYAAGVAIGRPLCLPCPVNTHKAAPGNQPACQACPDGFSTCNLGSQARCHCSAPKPRIQGEAGLKLGGRRQFY